MKTPHTPNHHGHYCFAGKHTWICKVPPAGHKGDRQITSICKPCTTARTQKLRARTATGGFGLVKVT